MYGESVCIFLNPQDQKVQFQERRRRSDFSSDSQTGPELETRTSELKASVLTTRLTSSTKSKTKKYCTRLVSTSTRYIVLV